MWWLGQGQNAAAVQALVAAFTGLLTTILLLVTWKYVRLTSRLASITAKNLEVAVLPNLIFSIEGTDKPPEDTRTFQSRLSVIMPWCSLTAQTSLASNAIVFFIRPQQASRSTIAILLITTRS